MSLFLSKLVKRKDLKSKIVELLSEEKPLNAKKIHSKLGAEYGFRVSYQGVHKALKELQDEDVLEVKNKAYSISIGWLKSLHNFAEISLAGYCEQTTTAENCVMEVFEDPDAYYVYMLPLFRTEKILRFSSKSPSLILEKERNLTLARKKYAKELEDAIVNKRLKVKYLISEDYTKKLILEYKDSKAIEKLKKFMKMDNIQVRCAPTKAIISYAVGKKDLFINPTAITHDESLGPIYIRGNMDGVIKIFDTIFIEAKEINDLVKELEQEMRKE